MRTQGTFLRSALEWYETKTVIRIGCGSTADKIYEIQIQVRLEISDALRQYIVAKSIQELKLKFWKTFLRLC